MERDRLRERKRTMDRELEIDKGRERELWKEIDKERERDETVSMDPDSNRRFSFGCFFPRRMPCQTNYATPYCSLIRRESVSKEGQIERKLLTSKQR